MEMKNLQQLFWDVEEKNLSLLGAETIISRGLSYGTFAQIRELFHMYGKNAIRGVFVTLKQNALSPRRRDYFTLILS